MKDREERLAETLARRQTKEFIEAGRKLVRDLERAEAEEKERNLLRLRTRQWERQQAKPVTDAEVSRAVKQCEAAIKEACLDMGIPEVESDTIAYDIIMGQCHGMRPKLVTEVRRVMLGIIEEEDG